MSDAGFLSLALVAAITGMMAFSLSISAHWKQLAGDRAHPRMLRFAFRIVGGAILAASFLLCAAADPVTMAMLVWPMLLTVSAAFVAAGLTLHARTSRANKVIEK